MLESTEAESATARRAGAGKSHSPGRPACQPATQFNNCGDILRAHGCYNCSDEVTGFAVVPTSHGVLTSGVRARPAVELPTLLLLIVAYGGWLGITSRYAHWPLWIVAPLAAVLITLHS